MGRNLWVNTLTLSRDFTVLIWDDLLDIFPPRPEPVTSDGLGQWLAQVRRLGATGPTIYQIWRSRPNGWSESAVAHAWDNGRPVQIEGCYERLILSPLEEMPKLDYEPPPWLGPELFAEAFRDAPLSLQAQPIAAYFSAELDLLDKALEGSQLEWGIL